MKILIICHHFPPLNKVGTYRVYSFVKEWASQGHVIDVITTQKYSIDRPLTYLPDLPTKNLVVYEIPYAKWLTNRFKNKQSENDTNFINRPLSKPPLSQGKII